jgi:cytosine/adenosine deaminase-related metal-dependent hydrolase
MSHDKFPPGTPKTENSSTHDHGSEGGFSRRDFLKSSAAGLAAGTIAGGSLVASQNNNQNNNQNDDQDDRGDRPDGGPGRRILLKGGVVLSLDPTVGDFERADVLIEGKKILAVGPNIGGGGQVVDCRGMIVMPGFISTHNHQYEAIQRSIIADGLIVFAGDADQQKTDPIVAGGGKNLYEAYGTVVQGIWTAGRLVTPPPENKVVWDIQRPASDPEDLYIAELVASLSQITQGITCGTDTSQASHTPAHTDAMIKGLMDSGRRSLYDYSAGTNRSGSTTPNSGHEYPGIMGNENLGVGRLRKKYFSSDDQLVTLGLGAGAGPAFPGATYSGWQLAKSFGCWINNHNVGNPAAVIDNAAQLSDPEIGPKLTLVHCVRWQDNSIAQISYDNLGYPSPATSNAWQILADTGGHVSIAVLIEQQMRHGMPPMQMALNHGILPSLSPDVDTNMTPDPFSMMRGAFCLQRGLANDLTFAKSDPGGLPTPQLVTARQCVEMMTIAGAAGSGLLEKVGTLKPGKEADIVILDYNNINFQPMNNVYGTIVTMMDTRAVRHVMIAGKFVYWHGKLVGWNVDRLTRQIVESRNRVLRRINGPAVGSDSDIIHRGKNSFGHPYRPAYLTSCCYNGQNEFAPQYVLRP